MGELDTLFVKVINKDKQAFEELYKKTSPKLFAVCLHLVNYDKKIAKDVLQEAFVKIWDKADTFNPKQSSPIIWMATVVRNQAFGRLRSNKSPPKSSKKLAHKCWEYSSPKSAFIDKKAYSEQIALLKNRLEELPDIRQQM